ncbi:MAG: hypothetical protein RXO36_07555 [Candidatus Nanopusillus acidilobi]|jgi:hypothetical protein
MVKKKTYVSKKERDLIDFALIIIFGLVLTFSLIASIYMKYGEYVFSAVMFTGLFWSTVEIMTPRGTHWGHALIRFIPAIILGIIFGGVLTYYTQFGYYIIEPALSGNMIAVFTLASIVYATLIMIWTAVWAHNHQFIAFRR